MIEQLDRYHYGTAFTYQQTYGYGSTAASVASGLVYAINSNASSPVTAFLGVNGQFNLYSKTTGVITDFFMGGSVNGSWTPPSYQLVHQPSMVGGTDPAY